MLSVTLNPLKQTHSSSPPKKNSTTLLKLVKEKRKQMIPVDEK
jgi:hypothetical protein